MDIRGKIKVKAKVNEMTGAVSYRTVLTSKDKDGETIYATIFIHLVKDARNKPIDNDTYININNGFLSFNKNANNETIYTAVISDFDYIDDSINADMITPIEAGTVDDLPF